MGHRSEFNSNTENSISPYNSWIHLNAAIQIIDLLTWTIEMGCTEILFWATFQPTAFLEAFGNRSFLKIDAGELQATLFACGQNVEIRFQSQNFSSGAHPLSTQGTLEAEHNVDSVLLSSE